MVTESAVENLQAEKTELQTKMDDLENWSHRNNPWIMGTLKGNLPGKHQS